MDFALFILSFVFIILDIKNYTENRYADMETTKIPKKSSYGLLCGLLALILAVIASYVGI
ncbi:MAG: hypothetical protein ACXAAI_12660 [Promethearchaeota archaeon]|jgi:hypothetical protein